MCSQPLPISLSALESTPARVDLEFREVSHGGASFEGRVFVNNPKASEKTSYRSQSYAGSFFVFGHGGCFGSEGHCDVPEVISPFDRRPEHPLMPAHKRINATAAILHALSTNKGKKPATSITVTVVPVVNSATEKCDVENVLRFRELAVVVYD